MVAVSYRLSIKMTFTLTAVVKSKLDFAACFRYAKCLVRVLLHKNIIYFLTTHCLNYYFSVNMNVVGKKISHPYVLPQLKAPIALRFDFFCIYT
jgi:hypothetical protein